MKVNVCLLNGRQHERKFSQENDTKVAHLDS